MAKIVIDARQYTTSTGRYTFRLIQYLEKLDSENEYVVLLKPNDMNVYEFTNPRFTKLACPHKEFTVDEQVGLLKQVKSLNADLVHFAIVQQPIRYRGRHITTIHDLTTARFKNPAKNNLVFTVKQQVYKWVIRQAVRKSQHIITISNFVKSDIVAFTGVDPQKLTVTYEAADAITDAPEPIEELQDKPFLLYVGRPTPHKNLERLIEAHQQIRRWQPELLLVLAGKKDANYQRIEAEVTARNLSGIVFTDFISEGQLRWLYEHCAAYVFPSLSEGFGLPGLEAMVHGAPVVASNATCLPEIYGPAAHYFDPLNINAMSTAINDVLTNEELRNDLIQEGKVQAAKYSWQRMAEQTLGVYTQVLNAPK
ncbi:MAG TPA: glycosyltransferase family 1 protein [Candidatus Saccharimonadales bacterium]|nr:glycosyltransferase family 1 protein [Candidatus Saccharimonadales bacterium]